MFYPELLLCLQSDAAVAATVSTYEITEGETVSNIPSVFRDLAPEKAKLPYIVVAIDSRKDPASIIKVADVKIDYYDYNVSRLKADQFAKAVEDLLDLMKMDSEDYSDIRFKLSDDGYIPQSDPRIIHYNTTFGARASRKGWMQRTR